MEYFGNGFLDIFLEDIFLFSKIKINMYIFYCIYVYTMHIDKIVLK